MISKPITAWPINYIRDWKILVTGFAVILIILSIFSWQIYLSNKIAGGYLAPKALPADIAVSTIDKSRLQNILLLLTNKQNEYFLQKSNQQKLVDPAI